MSKKLVSLYKEKKLTMKLFKAIMETRNSMETSEKKLTMKLFKAIMETRNSMETSELHLIGCVGELRI